MIRFTRTTSALSLALGLSTCAITGRAAEAEQVAAAPVNPEAAGLLTLGAHLTDRGDFASAEVAYRRILDGAGFSSADEASALYGLARTFRKAGTEAKAAALYEKFLKQFPADERVPDALLDLGRTLRSMGATKLALNRFYSVIHSTLKLPAQGFEHYQSLARTAEYEIAETYYESGDYVRSGKYFGRLQLLDLGPADRARASFMSAHSQQLAGDLELSARSLRTFLETWPSDENVPEARFLLATTLRKLNRPQEALAVTLELLRQEKGREGATPRTWSYWQRRTGNMLANDFFQNGDTLNALTIYRNMSDLSAEPNWRLSVLYQVALCYERLHSYEQARVTYRSIVEAAGALKPEPPVDVAELAQMSTWRLNYLVWLDHTDNTLSELLNHSHSTPLAAVPLVTKNAPARPSPL